jgi:peptide/nickel transport system substrate-binding protein
MAVDPNRWFRRGLSRRSALRIGVMGGASAAFIAACGGSDNNKSSGSSGTAASGGPKTLVTETAGTAVTGKQPKSGGTLSFQMSQFPPSFDPYTQTSFTNSYVNGLVYSKLYRFKAGVPEIAPGDISMEPDLAQKMPEQADPTTLTMKLKPAKWHNQPPLNGRALTSEDVKYAIDRYQNYEKSVHKTFWSFVDKIETPDPQTISLKLKFPYADAVQIMGGNLGAYISPKEFAEGPDAPTKMLGSGPFMFDSAQNGVSITFKKNPDYYDKPYPYVDQVTAFIVTDESKRVADFSAKSVDISWLFLPDSRDQLKKQRPDAKFDEQQGISGYIYMRTDKAPFNDRRVRQALSMGINRKALREAITKGEGIEDQAMFVGMAGWARQVKELSGAKYWDFNPAEAKKLLEAAGATNLSFTWDHADAPVYTQAYVDTATLTQAQWKESLGVTVKDQQAPYAQYISTTYQGQYDFMGHSPRAVPYYVDALSDQYYWGTARARINLSYVNDQRWNQLLDKQRGQYTMDERKATIKQIEDLLSEEQWQIYFSTDTRTYFWNPDVTNYRPTAFFPYTHLMKTWKDKA